MRFYQLLEAKSEKAIAAILRIYGEKIQAKLDADSHLPPNRRLGNVTPTFLIDMLVHADPTKNSIYVDWLLKQWLAGAFRYYEDVSKAYEPLEMFEKLKPKLPVDQRDINRFKTFAELETFLDSHKDTDTRSENEKERQYEANLIKSGQAKIFLDSADIKIVIPKSQEAAMYFGRNTKWCTAAKNDNAFAYYNIQGPLYIILFKKENKRWQFHFESAQFMDEQDDELGDEQIQSVSHLFPNKIWLKAIEDDGNLIRFVNEPSQALMLAAVNSYATSIRYIKNPPEKIQLVSVKWEPQNIQFIDNPTEKIQLFAVRNQPQTIGKIKNPAENVCLMAVKTVASLISQIENPSEDVQRIAVTKDGNCLRYIANPTEKIKILALKNDPSVFEAIKKPSEELTKYAVSQWGYNIQHIAEPSEELQELAVKSEPWAISYIARPSENTQLLAVTSVPDTITYIKNPSIEVCKAAIKNDPYVIKHIRNPAEELQMLAVRTDKHSYFSIKKPTARVTLLFNSLQ